MHEYQGLLRHILNHGERKDDRTGTGTLSVFAYQMRFNLAAGFPLCTTKKLHIKSIVHELLWFLSGSTNNNDLLKHGVTIWNEWAKPDGDLGPVYGKAWRSWPDIKTFEASGDYTESSIDQIGNVVYALKRNPDSRRHIVTAWNPATVDECALPPCHVLFQFYVTAPKPDGRRRLNLHLYQRSADCFLGIPFNIASYALLLAMVAQVTGYDPGEFVHTLGDAHLYVNHLEQAHLQLTRTPRQLPQLLLNPNLTALEQFRFDDIAFSGYDPHPNIQAKVAV